MGIALLVILAEVMIGKWIPSWILTVGLIVILMVFLISSRYYEYQFRDTQMVLNKVKFMLKNLGIFIVILAVLIYMFGGEKFSQPTYKKLNITMKDNNPCFYLESFTEMDAFDVHGIQIIKSATPYERYWGVGYFADKYKQIKIPLSSFSGEAQCIPYGAKNEFFSEPSKKLETDVLYSATMDGGRRNISKGKEEDDGNWLTANVWFYLTKNQKTGQIEAIEREQYLKDKNTTSK